MIWESGRCLSGDAVQPANTPCWTDDNKILMMFCSLVTSLLLYVIYTISDSDSPSPVETPVATPEPEPEPVPNCRLCVCVFVALVLFLSTELVHLPFTFLKPPTPHFTDTISTSLIIRVKLPTVLFSPALDQSSFSDKGCLKLKIESTKEEQTNTLLCTV